MGQSAVDTSLYKQVGSIEAKVDALHSEVAEIKQEIRNLSVVTRADWEKRNAYVDQKLTNHEERLILIEEANLLASKSLWTVLRGSLGASAIRIVTYVIVGIFVVGLAYFVFQLSEYREIVKHAQQAQ